MGTRLDIDVLSLFDGMGCGWIALRELGIVPRKCYASEIDKHAIAQVKLNFPEVEHLGDVTKWRGWNIDWSRMGLLLAGSPCQGFSFAGKQLAFDDPRSALFFVFADILDHVKKANPNAKFLLENVNMKREHMRVINERLGISPVNINSALVSAQNRNRWYWSNIRTKSVGLFGEAYTDIPQPEDRGILLGDVLQDDVPERYYLSEKVASRLLLKRHTRGGADKAKCLTTKGNDSDMNIICVSSYRNNATRTSDKSAPLLAYSGGGNVPMIIQTPRGRNKGGVFSDKAPTLSARSYEHNNHVIQLNASRQFGSEPRQQDRVYSVEGKAPTLNAHSGGSLEPKILRCGTVRRLTPTECARLQTIPDWYKWNCSETQQYRMLGNGWTVEVIKYILSYLTI